MSKGEGVCVCVRLRCEAPPNGLLTVRAATNAIWVNDTNLGEEEFAYDHVFEGFTNHSVYGILGKRLLKSIFDGYNCCVFAYGQTGSGKTHTMIGSNSDPGIIPQLCQDLFARIEELRTGAEEGQAFKTEVEVEYMEIYNEKIRDLFSGNKEHKDSMKVREHPKKGVYVEGVIRKVVDTAEDIAQLMEAGNKERAVAKTDMNAVSSRSHAIFIIRFTQSCMEVDEETGKEVVSSQKTSCVNLVDLAGSERVKRSGVEGKELKEAVNINKSLSALGNVIAKLADADPQGDKGQKEHIPYRDTKLTWLLKESLGGNSKTVMVATVNPMDSEFTETLSTLRYASKCKRIVNNVVMNEDKNAKMMKVLQQEIATLRQLLAQKEEVADDGKEALLKQLQLTQHEMETRQALWESEKENLAVEREREATQRLLKEMEEMKRTHEQEYAMLKQQLEEQSRIQQTSDLQVKESELLVSDIHQRTEGHRTEIARYQSELQDLQQQIAREREAAWRSARELQEKETKFLDQLTERDSDLAQAFNENDNRVFVLQLQLQEKASEVLMLREAHDAKCAEMAAAARESEECISELRHRVQVLEDLLTESQRERYQQRIFNGGSVLDGSKWQEHVPKAVVDAGPPSGIDPYIIAHQEALLKSARATPRPPPAESPAGVTPAASPDPVASAANPPHQAASLGHTSSGAGQLPPAATATTVTSPPPPQRQRAAAQPGHSGWDELNQTLIDLGFSEEDRAEVVMSGVDLDNQDAVFNHLAVCQRRKALEREATSRNVSVAKLPTSYRPRADSPPGPSVLASGPGSFSPALHLGAQSPSFAASVTQPMRNPKLAKKECESLIMSQLMSPMSEDPQYCCTTLLSFVAAGTLTPKEILKPLKLPLKKEPPHMQISAINILDGLMARGPVPVQAAIVSKKWIDRLLEAGRRSPNVGARVLQALQGWQARFSSDPQMLHVLAPALERYFQQSSPGGLI
eukprot:GGOE01004771.1.p1 GENE.GGOE01004771.1~~GGOE01004771.1.p1  ORF type:complete len:976 (-),score=328.12 GGOE01004771.1:708-3635(-)